MMYLGKDAVGINLSNMKLIHQHTITQNYTSTLSSLYQNEISPYITFGDYSKLCIIIFRNNTSTQSNTIDCIFFGLGTDITSATSNERNGGMVRSNYTNYRNFLLSNDARCSEGTELYIYELSLT